MVLEDLSTIAQKFILTGLSRFPQQTWSLSLGHLPAGLLCCLLSPYSCVIPAEILVPVLEQFQEGPAVSLHCYSDFLMAQAPVLLVFSQNFSQGIPRLH